MAKKVLKIKIQDGTPHNGTGDDWAKSHPIVIAGTPHDGVPIGTLVMGLGPAGNEFSKNVAVRTDRAGALFLEIDG